MVSEYFCSTGFMLEYFCSAGFMLEYFCSAGFMPLFLQVKQYHSVNTATKHLLKSLACINTCNGTDVRSNLKAISMNQMLKRTRMKKFSSRRTLNQTLLQRKVKPSKFKRKTLKGMRTLKRTTTVMKEMKKLRTKRIKRTTTGKFAVSFSQCC